MRSPIQDYLERLHAECRDLRSGLVADDIPQLALADPEWFGVCVATTDGQVYEVGDTRQAFTIQSMSKPFTYGMALAAHGRDGVREKVGVEPSGDAFNSISLTPETGRPLNPMINAGAITAASLIPGATSDEQLVHLLEGYGAFAGRPLSVDEAVFASERDTGHRNRAIGHMLRTFDVLTEDPEETLELYFRQCSVTVDARDVALMAATLANGGVHPISGRRALQREMVEAVLSVMTTCGMYDGAGEWVEGVGMPAKSGVSGGILAVLPGQLGVCVFSPRLDRHGNSVRGVEVCRRLSSGLELHFLHVARSSHSTVRAAYTIAGVPSRRRRPAAERELLEAVGDRVLVLELQGDLLFAAVESVVRTVVDRDDALDLVVLDLRPVTKVPATAAQLLIDLHASMAAEGHELVFVDIPAHADVIAELEAAGARVFADVDAATEWAENEMLDRHGVTPAGGAPIALAEHGVCSGLHPFQLAQLEGLLTTRAVPAGTAIMRTGEPADEIYLLAAGHVSVQLPLADGGVRRLATLAPGMTFGELAVVGHATRTVDAFADGDVELLVLRADVLAQLGTTNPALKAALLQNMLAGAYESVGRMTREVASLGRAR
jgi:glutaminase